MSAVSDTVYKHTAPIVPVKRSNVLHVINAVMSLATTKRSITPEIISLQGKSIRCTSTSEYNFFAPLRRKRANWIFGFPKLSERKSLLIVNSLPIRPYLIETGFLHWSLNSTLIYFFPRFLELFHLLAAAPVIVVMRFTSYAFLDSLNIAVSFISLL